MFATERWYLPSGWLPSEDTDKDTSVVASASKWSQFQIFFQPSNRSRYYYSLRDLSLSCRIRLLQVPMMRFEQSHRSLLQQTRVQCHIHILGHQDILGLWTICSNLTQKSNVSMAFSGIIILLFPRGKLESNFYLIHLHFPWKANQYREFEVQEMLLWVISPNIYDIRQLNLSKQATVGEKKQY